MVPHGESELSPDDFFPGNRHNMRDPNKFGQRVLYNTSRYKEAQYGKSRQKMIFIEYKATSSQIYYWYMDSNLLKTYKHVRFYEVINDI